MPFGTYLELSEESGYGAGDDGSVGGGGGSVEASLCAMPYCVLIALCSVSVLVTVAIAVDRLTSLAQPLRYKNIITHSSIEKYIAVFWIYATAVGLSPLIYARIAGGVVQAQRYETLFLSSGGRDDYRTWLFLEKWVESHLRLQDWEIFVGN